MQQLSLPLTTILSDVRARNRLVRWRASLAKLASKKIDGLLWLLATTFLVAVQDLLVKRDLI